MVSWRGWPRVERHQPGQASGHGKAGFAPIPAPQPPSRSPRGLAAPAPRLVLGGGRRGRRALGGAAVGRARLARRLGRRGAAGAGRRRGAGGGGSGGGALRGCRGRQGAGAAPPRLPLEVEHCGGARQAGGVKQVRGRESNGSGTGGEQWCLQRCYSQLRTILKVVHRLLPGRVLLHPAGQRKWIQRQGERGPTDGGSPGAASGGVVKRAAPPAPAPPAPAGLPTPSHLRSHENGMRLASSLSCLLIVASAAGCCWLLGLEKPLEDVAAVLLEAAGGAGRAGRAEESANRCPRPGFARQRPQGSVETAGVMHSPGTGRWGRLVRPAHSFQTARSTQHRALPSRKSGPPARLHDCLRFVVTPIVAESSALALPNTMATSLASALAQAPAT